MIFSSRRGVRKVSGRKRDENGCELVSDICSHFLTVTNVFVGESEMQGGYRMGKWIRRIIMLILLAIFLFSVISIAIRDCPCIPDI